MTELTKNDVDAILCCVEITLSCELGGDFGDIFGVSAVKKLIVKQHLSNPEAIFVALSVDNAYKILRGEIAVDDESVASLRPYFFTINKLQSVFSDLLSQ